METKTMWLLEKSKHTSWPCTVDDTLSFVKTYLPPRFIGIMLLCFFCLTMFMALKR